MIILSSILFNTVLYCIRVLFSFPLFSEFTDDHIHSNIKSVRDFYDLLEFLQHLGLYNNALRKLCNQLFQYYSILANKQIKYNVIHTYQHTVLSYTDCWKLARVIELGITNFIFMKPITISPWYLSDCKHLKLTTATHIVSYWLYLSLNRQICATILYCNT